MKANSATISSDTWIKYWAFSTVGDILMLYLITAFVCWTSMHCWLQKWYSCDWGTYVMNHNLWLKQIMWVTNIDTQSYYFNEWNLWLIKNFFYNFHIVFMVAYLLSPNRCQWSIAKVKNYNLNVTEVLDPVFPMLPGIFNFTVGILTYNKNTHGCVFLQFTIFVL